MGLESVGIAIRAQEEGGPGGTQPLQPRGIAGVGIVHQDGVHAFGGPGKRLDLVSQ